MRLTIDIDGKNMGWWAYGVYYSLRDSGIFYKVELRRTRKGYHIVAFGCLSEYEVDILRRSYGDDKVRIYLDTIKDCYQPKNVLWCKKNGYEVKVLESWKEERC